MKNIVILVILVVLLLIITGCSTTGNIVKSSTVEPIKIGVIVPRTGALEFYGSYMLNAIQIEVEKRNSQGGINGRPIQLVVEDSRCDPKETVTALMKLKHSDNVIAAIGPLCGSPSKAAGAFAEQNILLLSLLQIVLALYTIISFMYLT